MEKEIRAISPEYRIKRDDSGKAVIQGYAAVFNSWSEDLGGFREKIKPGAFAKALKRSDARALFNHDANFILGRQGAKTLRLKEDKTGLWMEVDIPDTQAGRDLLVSIERGDIHQQSFGFTVRKDEWQEDRNSETVERTVVEIEQLYDVSPVTYPAYPDTSVAARTLNKMKESGAFPGKNKSGKRIDPEKTEASENTDEDAITIRIDPNIPEIAEAVEKIAEEIRAKKPGERRSVNIQVGLIEIRKADLRPKTENAPPNPDTETRAAEKDAETGAQDEELDVLDEIEKLFEGRRK